MDPTHTLALATQDLGGALIVGGSILVVLRFAALLRRRGVEAELTRKAAHVGTSLAAVPLFWLVHSPWTVVILAGFFGVFIAIQRHRKHLDFLDDVKRSRLSEAGFIGAVVLLEVGSGGVALRYVAPLLILGFSDALAAVVGGRWGRHQYTVGTSTKSWEGSAAFAVSAWVVLLGGLLATRRGLDGSEVVISAVMSLALAVVEAVSVRGLDNLLVPVAALVLVRLGLEGPLPPVLPSLVQGLLLVFPIWAAGAAHQLVRRRRWFACTQRSLDAVLFQGREVFGGNKTLRGFLVVPVACALAVDLELALCGAPGLLPAPSAWLWAFPLSGGLLLGLAYVAAELPNSYLKRRLGIAPGSQATRARPLFFALDHLDSALGCAAAYHLLQVPWETVALGMGLGPVIHVGFNRASHVLRLREAAW